MENQVCILKLYNPGQEGANWRVFARNWPIESGEYRVDSFHCPMCKGSAFRKSKNGKEIGFELEKACFHARRAYDVCSGKAPILGAIKLYPEILDFCLNDQIKEAMCIAANDPNVPKARPGAFPVPKTPYKTTVAPYKPTTPPAPPKAPEKPAEAKKNEPKDYVELCGLWVDITPEEIKETAEAWKAKKDAEAAQKAAEAEKNAKIPIKSVQASAKPAPMDRFSLIELE